MPKSVMQPALTVTTRMALIVVNAKSAMASSDALNLSSPTNASELRSANVTVYKKGTSVRRPVAIMLSCAFKRTYSPSSYSFFMSASKRGRSCGSRVERMLLIEEKSTLRLAPNAMAPGDAFSILDLIAPSSVFSTRMRIMLVPSVGVRSSHEIRNVVWTKVLVTGESLKGVEQFVKGECDAAGRCTFSAPGDLRIALGFDGFVCNEDSAFVLTHVVVLKESKPAYVARFETRWNPPLAFFERMASRYPFLTFLMHVDHEDDESYPDTFFKVPPLEYHTTSAPPPSRQTSDESEIATQ